jgi:hypothetical protein
MVSQKAAGEKARVTAILGSQWGDEGKGKLADVLAKNYDVVARFNGGANAGHTVVVGDRFGSVCVLRVPDSQGKEEGVIVGGVTTNPTHLSAAAAAPSASATSRPSAEASLERFLTQRLWGYGTTRSGSRLRYRVDHPLWNLHDNAQASITLDHARIYGQQWGILTTQPPISTILAAGSEVSVMPWSA